MLGQLIQAPVAPFRARGNALLNAQQHEKNQREEELAMLTRDLLNQQANRPQGVDPAAIRRDEISASGLDTEKQNRMVAQTTFDNQQTDRKTSQQEALSYIQQLANLDVDNPLFNAEFDSGNTSPEAAQRLRQMLGAIEGRDHSEERQDFIRGDEHLNSQALNTQEHHQRRAQNSEAGDRALKSGLALANNADSLTRQREADNRAINEKDYAVSAANFDRMAGNPPGTTTPEMFRSAANAQILASIRDYVAQESKAAAEISAENKAELSKRIIELQKAKDGISTGDIWGKFMDDLATGVSTMRVEQ